MPRPKKKTDTNTSPNEVLISMDGTTATVTKTIKGKSTKSAKKVEVKPEETTAPKTIDKVLDELGKNKYRVSLASRIIRPDKISTGSLLLDKELEGGYVKGRIVECFAPKSFGKTALGFTMLALIKDGLLGFIDAESSYDTETAVMYGVDPDRLLVGEPEYLEQGIDMVEDMINQGAAAIVYDSIAGVGPKVELEGDMDQHNVGAAAKRMSQAMRRLHLIAKDHGCVLFFVNQQRASMQMYGDPTTTPGGYALGFYATYRLQGTGIDRFPKEGPPYQGHHMKLKIEKNKLGHPGGRVIIPFLYGIGISREWELIDLAVAQDIVQQSGSWFSYDGTKIGQGKMSTVELLQDNPDLFEEIKSKLKL